MYCNMSFGGGAEILMAVIFLGSRDETHPCSAFIILCDTSWSLMARYFHYRSLSPLSVQARVHLFPTPNFFVSDWWKTTARTYIRWCLVGKRNVKGQIVKIERVGDGKQMRRLIYFWFGVCRIRFSFHLCLIVEELQNKMLEKTILPLQLIDLSRSCLKYVFVRFFLFQGHIKLLTDLIF
jgi:hypothetical protein